MLGEREIGRQVLLEMFNLCRRRVSERKAPHNGKDA
jgi:hypothetical protein